MPESSGRAPRETAQTWQNPISPVPLDHVVVPKRRSSLRNAHAGNHSIDSPYKDKPFQRRDLAHYSPMPLECLEDLAEKVEAFEISKKRLISTPTRSTPRGILTPPRESLEEDVSDDLDSRSLGKGRRESYFVTPIKKRAINYGRVVDTPPSSTDRFIPSRTRSDTAVNNFKANKPFFELTPAQQQMQLNGVTLDPFTTRRVTPVLIAHRDVSNENQCWSRVASASNVWTIGGSIPHLNHIVPVNAGRGVTLGSGTNAQLYSADFFDHQTETESHERYEARLAIALELDRSAKVLDFNFGFDVDRLRKFSKKTAEWKDGVWTSNVSHKVLDAPALRDDFYCTPLAYCTVSGLLAVGLKNQVYLWSESKGVQSHFGCNGENSNGYVTSLSFSSPAGRKGILVVGRSDGRICFRHPREDRDRLCYRASKHIGCLAFKPVPTKRFPELWDAVTTAEELLVGDEKGDIYYFSLKWPRVERPGRCTTLTLLAKLSIHKGQVCGVAWSPDGEYFASGGNDNLCFAVAIRDILEMPSRRKPGSQKLDPLAPAFVPKSDTHYTLISSGSHTEAEYGSITSTILQEGRMPSRLWPLILGRDRARHCWPHGAAVKAIAFCPWQKGLIATGGGSNDRAVHFFHVKSGACLATIRVHAQVTSLIWSTTKREICVTLGYSQPDHPYRIAVFSWPECEQVVRIPWNGNMRALHAVAYPGGPNDKVEPHSKTDKKRKGKPKTSEGETWWSRTKEEGCIVVVASDDSIKFYEVWSGQSCSMGSKRGGLGWSSILEDEEGDNIDLGGSEVIR